LENEKVEMEVEMRPRGGESKENRDKKGRAGGEAGKKNKKQIRFETVDKVVS